MNSLARNSTSNPYHSVQFSETCEIRFVEPQGQWHNVADMLSFRRQLITDANELRRMLTADPAGHDFIGDDKYKCIGIEMFCSRAIAMEAMDKRLVHIRSVLRKQERQRATGSSHDVEDLCRVSMDTSLWARERASARAFFYRDL